MSVSLYSVDVVHKHSFFVYELIITVWSDNRNHETLLLFSTILYCTERHLAVDKEYHNRLPMQGLHLEVHTNLIILQ